VSSIGAGRKCANRVSHALGARVRGANVLIHVGRQVIVVTELGGAEFWERGGFVIVCIGGAWDTTAVLCGHLDDGNILPSGGDGRRYF